ncbi:MAG: BamA/TamA family outer membrane protein [Alphaproteobacteria bacterium]|nr:BamA/TamA family outer membrane protein [Alphaproteobacteria bacterium]
MVASARAGRWLLWLLVLLAACTPARRKVRGDIVRRIEFHGNGGALSGHNDYQLRKAMEQPATAFGVKMFPITYFVDPKLLNRDFLVRDAYRLEVWYAHHGWFDAHFLGWSVKRVKHSKKRRAGVVDVLGIVEPGKPSLVRSYDVVGGSRATGGLGRTVLRTGYLKEKKQFDLELAEADRVELEVTLKQRGYAYANVDLQTDAFPDEHAVDVKLEMQPGILANNGAITIEGNQDVKTRFITQNLRLVEGEPYRLDELVAAQNRLFRMGTFALVSVEPDLSDPTRKDVPIRVRVREAKFRALRFGVGFQIQGLQNFEPNVSMRFKHTNLLSQLIGLDFLARVGAVANVGDRPFAPTWQVRGSVIYPRILGQKVAQQLEVNIEQGVQQGSLRFFNPEADFRSIWRPSDIVVVSLGPHIEQFDYLDYDTESRPARRQAEALFGDGFVNPYQITSVDFGFTLDWRDDPLSTKRGSFFNTTLRTAFPLKEGDFAFLAFTGDWRLFRPIRVGKDVPLTWATRIHGKALYPIGDNKNLPYPELFFPGGATSMRGFPSGRMGPYAITVEGEGDSRVVSYAQVGGNLGAVVQQEIRYYGAYGITYAAFLDVATLTNPGRSATDFRIQVIDGFRFAGGLGLRYGSPVGPLRIDVSVRPRYLEDFQTYEDAASCDVNDDRRRLDVVHAFAKCSRFPAIMVFGAFGEAI